jgi:hypothetical protein
MIAYSKGRKLIVFDVLFYRDRNGKEPVLEFIQELDNRRDKEQDTFCGLGWQEFYTPTPLHEENPENTTEGNRQGQTKSSRFPGKEQRR